MKEKLREEKRPFLKTLEKEYDKFETANACSAYDCTGLIQVPPQNEEEQEAYMDIYDYRAPKVASEEEKK